MRQSICLAIILGGLLVVGCSHFSSATTTGDPAGSEIEADGGVSSADAIGTYDAEPDASSPAGPRTIFLADAGTAVVDCSNGCRGPIACPPGWHCIVSCHGEGSCTDVAVECNPGLGCVVECAASGACRRVSIAGSSTMRLCLRCLAVGKGAAPACDKIVCEAPTSCALSCPGEGGCGDDLGDCRSPQNGGLCEPSDC